MNQNSNHATKGTVEARTAVMLKAKALEVIEEEILLSWRYGFER
jgi:hypothetical protein